MKFKIKLDKKQKDLLETMREDREIEMYNIPSFLEIAVVNFNYLIVFFSLLVIWSNYYFLKKRYNNQLNISVNILRNQSKNLSKISLDDTYE